jgi:endonuclease YncB( thermonuclease family)
MRKTALLIFATLFSFSVHAETIAGKVVGVMDGDTIKVLQNNEEFKIRLYGIDCPEKKLAFGQKAKAFTSSLDFGKNVSVEVRAHDRYGRYVGWITLPDSKILNEEILKAGFAWWYQQYAKKEIYLGDLEKGAREKKLGLWSEKNPTPPWEFRHGGKKAEKKAGELNLDSVFQHVLSK